jgi:hypoxanthine phosphoribosyltransferase
MTIAYHADSSALVDKEVLTWETFGTATRELAAIVAGSSFRPEIIVAVARGGLIPGGGLSYALGIKLTDAINVEFYTDVEETLPDPVLLAPHLDMESITGRHILVVDDVADSGRTLALVLRLLLDAGAEARSAVLYSKPGSEVTPDYVWRETDKWVVFPWSAEPPVLDPAVPENTATA